MLKTTKGMLSLLFLAGIFTLSAQTAFSEEETSRPAAVTGPSYQPLLTAETRLLVRFDVQKFDLTALTQRLNEFAASMIDQAVSDPDKATQYKFMVPLLLGSYLTGVSPLFDSLKKAEILEFYFVFTPEDQELSPGYFAIPVGERTKEELAPLRQNLMSLRNFGAALPLTFVRHGYIFAPLSAVGTSDEAFREHLKKRFQTLTPAENKAFDFYFAQNPDAALCAVFVNNDFARSDLEQAVADVSAAASEDPDTARMSALFTDHAAQIFRKIEGGSAVVRGDFSGCDFAAQLVSTEEAAKIPSSWSDLKSDFLDICADMNQDKEYQQQATDLFGRTLDLFTPTVEERTVRWTFDSAFTQKLLPLVKEFLAMQPVKKEAAPTPPLEPGPALTSPKN